MSAFKFSQSEIQIWNIWSQYTLETDRTAKEKKSTFCWWFSGNVDLSSIADVVHTKCICNSNSSENVFARVILFKMYLKVSY